MRDDIRVEFHEYILTLLDENEDVKFSVKILLSGAFSADNMRYTFCNERYSIIKSAKS